MFKDYDLSDLERRLSNVEKKLSKPTFCHFLEQQEGKLAKKKHIFDFEFVVDAKTYLKIISKVKIKGEQLYKLKLFLNDAFAHEWEFNTSEGKIEFLLPVSEGLNKTSVICESDSDIEVESCLLETFGNISYKQDDYQLLHLVDNDKTYVILYQNESATLKKYQNGGFSFVKEWKELKSIAICKLKQNILIVYANKQGNMVVELYNDNFTLIESGVVDDGITSVCAISGEMTTLIAVRGNTIYKYLLNSCNSFEKLRTEFKGKRVHSNPDINGYIITDFNGFAKLVTL